MATRSQIATAIKQGFSNSEWNNFCKTYGVGSPNYGMSLVPGQSVTSTPIALQAYANSATGYPAIDFTGVTTDAEVEDAVEDAGPTSYAAWACAGILNDYQTSIEAAGNNVDITDAEDIESVCKYVVSNQPPYWAGRIVYKQPVPAVTPTPCVATPSSPNQTPVLQWTSPDVWTFTGKTPLQWGDCDTLGQKAIKIRLQNTLNPEVFAEILHVGQSGVDMGANEFWSAALPAGTLALTGWVAPFGSVVTLRVRAERGFPSDSNFAHSDWVDSVSYTVPASHIVNESTTINPPEDDAPEVEIVTSAGLGAKSIKWINGVY